MTSGKAILLLVALFLAGAMSGGFVGFNLGRRGVTAVAQPQPVKPPPGSNWRPPMREKTRDRLARELSLSEQQLVAVDPIIAEFDAQLETMNKRNWNDLALAISNRNERIKPHLTPEQIKILEERGFKRHGPPGPRRERDSSEKRN